MTEADLLHVRIGGMSCGGCVRGLARAFEKAGLRVDRLEVGQADFPSGTSLDAVRAAVESAGFRVLDAENA